MTYFKKLLISDNEKEKVKDVNVHYTSNSTVHNLVTFMCKNMDTLLLGQCPSNKIEDYTLLQAAIKSDINDVLEKLESEIDQRKEIGLFLKRGGYVLLRILLGEEIGLLSKSGCCIVGSVDELLNSGLLMRICRAVNACNLTERARESSFTSGITYLVSDLTLVLTGHLIDWLASHQWSYVNEGSNKRLIFSNECQSIPLLFSALTCQLNRTANIITSDDIESSRKAPYYGWIRYLFASGMVSTLCRAIRSMAPLHSHVSKEVFSYLLLYSLLECVDALCLCVMGLEQKTVTVAPHPSIDLKCVGGIYTPTSTPTSTSTLTSTPTSTPTTTPTPTSTSSTLVCDAKSSSELVPFSRKEMVCMLLDMQLAPTLVCMLER